MTHKKLKPEVLIRRYVDNALALDRQLNVISNLMLGFSDMSQISQTTMNDLGAMLNNLSERHRILIHCYFQEDPGVVDRGTLVGETARLTFDGSLSRK